MVHYREAQNLMLSERFELAEREFKAAIALDSLLVEAHYGLGQCYMSLRDFPAAVRAYTGCRTAHKEATLRQARKALDSERRRRKGSQALRDILAELNQSRREPQSPVVQTQQIRRQIVVAEQNIQQLDRLWGLGSADDQVPPGISVALGSAATSDLAPSPRPSESTWQHWPSTRRSERPTTTSRSSTCTWADPGGDGAGEKGPRGTATRSTPTSRESWAR